MKEVAEAASGSTLEMAVGEELTAVLAENPTTGFRWVAEVDAPTIVAVDGSAFRARASTPGAAGERVFKVTALASGVATLACKYWRAFEGERSVSRRFVLEIRVR